MKSLQLFSEQYNNSPVLDPIPYKETDLEPVISKQTIDYHFNNLAKTYLKRYNNNEGDPKFNLAGVYLHNLYFQQFQKPNKENKPIGISKTIIDQKYNSFTEFKKQIEKTAMSIQGSGWVYIDTDGEIKTIVNHKIERNIALIIDWWEHAWALDYKQDKKQYLNNIWSIINWSIVNTRITSKGNKK